MAYHYDGGTCRLRPPPQRQTRTGSPHSDRLAAEDVDKGISAEIAMQWNDGFAESVYTFANTINTTEGEPTKRASAPR